MARLIRTEQASGIDCDGLLLPGLRLALTTRFEEMLALRDAALDWSNPKGVHKMRVASRRLRGALRDFASYIGKRRISSSLKRIRDLAKALGQVRDYDVAVLTLQRLAAKAPVKLTAGVCLLGESREALRRGARADLERILSRDFLAELKKEFQVTLEHSPKLLRAARTTKPKGGLVQPSYRTIARSIILTRLEELEKLSTNLYHPHKSKPLHEMRIGAKHLRYALQLFEPCWGPSLTIFGKKLAELQTSLGELHDCDVWIEDLAERASDGVSDFAVDHRATVVWLLSHFIKRRSKHLCDALLQWQQWEASGLSARLRESILAVPLSATVSTESRSMNESRGPLQPLARQEAVD